ncbi:hypothetical protein BHE74_00004101 [Ensete ventricosum]|nr:hypothetical protein BHE74_00004101 [Ensete ventricosum]
MAAAKPFLPSSLLPAPPRRTESRRCRCLGIPVGPLRPRRQGRRGALAAVASLSLLPDPLFLLDVSSAAGDVGYSQASYYTSLGLFVISVPGLWSLIKRSVKSKIVQKTFVREEGAAVTPNQVAGEILSFFTRNNFAISDRGETIT